MDRSECYRVLELPDGASSEEIAQAYKVLVRVWHPDRFANDSDLHEAAQSKLKQINEAYSTLKSSDGESPEAEPSVYHFSCKYLGGDVRLKTFPGISIAGRKAAVELTADGLTLVIASGGQPDEVVHYPVETIHQIGTQQGGAWVNPKSLPRDKPLERIFTGDKRVEIIASDPEKLVPTFVFTLGFPNEYHRKLFSKRTKETLEFCRYQTPPQPKEADVKSPNAPPSGAGLFAALIVLFLAAMTFPFFVPALTTQSGPSSESSHVSGKKVTRDRLKVWLVPEKPKAGENYMIHIQIRLPSEGENHIQYPSADLKGSKILGDDGYRQDIPSYYLKRLYPVKDNTAELRVPVPGTDKGVRTTIHVESAMLNEDRTLVVETSE